MDAVRQKLRDAVSAGRDKIEGLDAGWILEDKLLQMSTPGGSVHQFWRNPESEVLRFCLDYNIKTILKLNMGDRYDTDLFERNGISVNTLNWADHQAPTLEKGLQAVTLLWQAYQRHASAVHCTAGIGRSGLISASFLIFLGLYDVDGAITLVRSKRKRAIKNPPQIEFLHKFSSFLSGNPWVVKQIRAMAVVPPSNIELTERYWWNLLRNNRECPGFSPYAELKISQVITYKSLYSHANVYELCLQENADRYPSLYAAIAAQQEFLNMDVFGGTADFTEISGIINQTSPSVPRRQSSEARNTSPGVLAARVAGHATIPDEVLHSGSFYSPLGETADVITSIPPLFRRLCAELVRSCPIPHVFSVLGTPDQIRSALDLAESGPLSDSKSLELACANAFLVRHFMWSFSESLIPKNLQMKAIKTCTDAKQSLKLLCECPIENQATIGCLVACLAEISRNTTLHNMQVSNLALFFAPSLFQLKGDISPINPGEAMPGSMPTREGDWMMNNPLLPDDEQVIVHLHQPPYALAGATRFLHNLIMASVNSISYNDLNKVDTTVVESITSPSIRRNADMSRSGRKDTTGDRPPKFHVRRAEEMPGAQIMFTRANVPVSTDDDHVPLEELNKA